MRTLTSLAAVGSVAAWLSLALVAGCAPDLGACDMPAARTVVYGVDDGAPAYAGQALIQASCGNGAFCHAELASDRFGAPAGLDFDLALAMTADETDRLRRGQHDAYQWRHEILQQVDDGAMPPGTTGKQVAALGIPYRDLPALDSSAGREILRNWLACGVPVVERTAQDRPASTVAVGAVVPADPLMSGTNSCATGELMCGGRCIDVTSNPSHCGACGNTCDLGRECVMGACASGCATSLTECGVDCVDLQSDFQHCGDCAVACVSGEVCANGACSADGCPVGTAGCAGSCVDLQTSILHCGACSMMCPTGQSCVMGACSCGDTLTDPVNCGVCGNVCPTGTDCMAGQCQCTGSLTFCGTRCVDIATDAANCGGCGASCGQGRQCEAGACVSCGTGVSFANNIQPIFTASCAGSLCHAGNTPAAGMSLVSGQAYSNLVGAASDCPDARPRVTAGLPDNSYLINKLTGMNMCRGGQMPLRSPALSMAQIDLVRSWICAGAPNN